MRSVVFAYHDIGYVCLEELLRAGAEVAAVFTHDDDPNEEIWFRSVRQLAEKHRLPVFSPSKVNTPEWIERLQNLAPDFVFSFYYRNLLGADVLASAKRGALNLHGSLLPRYRGRCPVNWVLIHDERETGVSLHYMELKPDRGDIVAQRVVPIDDDDTALTLFRKLTEAGAQLIRESYPLLCDGRAPRIPQDHSQASYFGGRRPDDGRINWNDSARQIFNLIRAVTHPYPGAFGLWDGRQFYIWESHPVAHAESQDYAPGTIVATQPQLIVQTGKGKLELKRVQLVGEGETSGSQWAAQSSVGKGATLK
ncbi:MAG TPA: formyltransferase [Candidatus Acidoferrales bacterium]|nr:formyltransferase [Candidatus Acidoferrales bacterium]